MFAIFVILWAAWAWKLIDNFSEDLKELVWWKEILLALILILGAPFFMVEEILEIAIGLILGEDFDE